MPGTQNISRTAMLKFGPFKLLPMQRLLIKDDMPVRISPRAFDILTMLTERSGQIVDKQELLKNAWPKTLVGEANLRVYVAELRKLLAAAGIEDAIGNVVGRGYQFKAPVEEAAEAATFLANGSEGIGLPVALSRMFGRADVVDTLSARVSRHRLVTISGAGGIGKTTVAIAAATSLANSYRDGARFIDLTPVSNASHVPATVASAVGIVALSHDPVHDLLAHLKNKHLLILLDNCEHVVEVAAKLAEEILKAAPMVRIIATSREPLNAEGEVILRLSPLQAPPVGDMLTAAEALAFPSVQLFAERAAASLDNYQLTDAEAPVVADICRRLDGLPLAIQLAASRVDAFGVFGLFKLLDDKFKLMMQGARTAVPRHRTLGATLDWSYGALAETEKAVLRRVSLFAGHFTLRAAIAVASGPDIGQSTLVDDIAHLVRKSLIVAEFGHANARYRLLSTTRAYAQERLAESEEVDQFSLRHAEYLRQITDQVVAEQGPRSGQEWLLAYADHIEDIRLALNWAFSPGGAAEAGVALTISAIPLWIDLSLNEECRLWAEAALSRLDPHGDRDSNEKLRLFSAVGGASLYTRGSAPELTAAWTSVLKIAERIGEDDYRLRAMWGLWSDRINHGENRAALDYANRFARSAASCGDPAASALADRLLGYSFHLLGEQDLARKHTELMLAHYTAPPDRSHIVRFQFDQQVMANIALASIMWLQGFPDKAVSIVEANVDKAKDVGHALSLTYVLVQSAVPVSLLAGDLEAAERYVDMLARQPVRHAAEPWARWTRCLKGVLLMRQGALQDGLGVLGSALETFPEHSFHMRYIGFLGELAMGLARAGKVEEGIAVADRAISAALQTQELWILPELLRIKGEILAIQIERPAIAAIEELFSEALSLAGRQNALSWQLRAASSTARFWQRLGRFREARDLLEPIYARFTEGFLTGDLREAQTLLANRG